MVRQRMAEPREQIEQRHGQEQHEVWVADPRKADLSHREAEMAPVLEDEGGEEWRAYNASSINGGGGGLGLAQIPEPHESPREEDAYHYESKLRSPNNALHQSGRKSPRELHARRMSISSGGTCSVGEDTEDDGPYNEHDTGVAETLRTLAPVRIASSNNLRRRGDYSPVNALGRPGADGVGATLQRSESMLAEMPSRVGKMRHRQDSAFYDSENASRFGNVTSLVMEISPRSTRYSVPTKQRRNTDSVLPRMPAPPTPSPPPATARFHRNHRQNCANNDLDVAATKPAQLRGPSSARKQARGGHRRRHATSECVSMFVPGAGEELAARTSPRGRNSVARPASLQAAKQRRRRQQPAFSMDALSLGSEIGAGTFGRVNTAFDMRSGVTYAVKRMSRSADGAETDRARAHAEEIKIMAGVRHENIVRYFDSRVSQDGEHLEICMEFVPGGSVASRVREFGPLGDQLVGKLTRDMLAGVSFLHEQGVIHRDIKGGNVLITLDGRAKVADFGCAKLLFDLDTADRQETLRRIRGSIPWMAPEVVRESNYHYPADIWSLGATVLEMTSGKRPWHHIAEQFAAIYTIGSTKAPPPIPETASITVRDFMLCCFRLKPEERASAAELAQHPLVLE